jgi:hypothetical protein
MLKTLADVFGIFANRGAGGAGTGIASLVAAAETIAAEGVAAGATPADDDATGCETDAKNSEAAVSAVAKACDDEDIMEVALDTGSTGTAGAGAALLMLKTLADVFGIFANRGAGGAGTGIASLVAAAETIAAEGVAAGATPADDDATGCETDAKNSEAAVSAVAKACDDEDTMEVALDTGSTGTAGAGAALLMLKTLADVFGIFANRGAGGAGTGIASLVAAAETIAAEGVAAGATPADDDATGCETNGVSAVRECVVAAEKAKEAAMLLTVDELLNTALIPPKTGRLKTGADA